MASFLGTFLLNIDSNDVTVFLGAFLLFYIIIFVISLAVAVVQAIATWKLYEKAGEKGWTSIVPVYNFFQMVKIATGNHTFAWIYMGICAVYVALTVFSSFLLEFSADNEIVGISRIFIMLVLFGLMILLYAVAGYVNFMFSKAYGKSTAWSVCMIFFSPILIIIMGFDKNTVYVGTNGIPQNYT